MELDQYRAVLTSKAAELIKYSKSNLEAIAVEVHPDPIDTLQQTADRDIAIQRFNRNASILRDVQFALKRLDEEDFGSCLHCEEAIALKRLESVPWAKYCIRCQEDIDTQAASSLDSNDTSIDR